LLSKHKREHKDRVQASAREALRLTQLKLRIDQHDPAPQKKIFKVKNRNQVRRRWRGLPRVETVSEASDLQASTSSPRNENRDHIFNSDVDI